MSSEDFTEGKILDFKRKAVEPVFADTNWLMKLDVNTIFLAKNTNPQQRTFVLAEFILVEKTEKSCRLCMQENNNKIYMWVDPNSFCGTWNWFETLQ